jgi:hypothetical protein
VFARRLRTAAVSYVRSDTLLSHGRPKSEGRPQLADPPIQCEGANWMERVEFSRPAGGAAPARERPAE